MFLCTAQSNQCRAQLLRIKVFLLLFLQKKKNPFCLITTRRNLRRIIRTIIVLVIGTRGPNRRRRGRIRRTLHNRTAPGTVHIRPDLGDVPARRQHDRVIGPLRACRVAMRQMHRAGMPRHRQLAVEPIQRRGRLMRHGVDHLSRRRRGLRCRGACGEGECQDQRQGWRKCRVKGGESLYFHTPFIAQPVQGPSAVT